MRYSWFSLKFPGHGVKVTTLSHCKLVLIHIIFSWNSWIQRRIKKKRKTISETMERIWLGYRAIFHHFYLSFNHRRTQAIVPTTILTTDGPSNHVWWREQIYTKFWMTKTEWRSRHNGRKRKWWIRFYMKMNWFEALENINSFWIRCGRKRMKVMETIWVNHHWSETLHSMVNA